VIDQTEKHISPFDLKGDRVMLFQQGTAETTNFMILGFAFIFIPMLIHIWSMYSRANRLNKDMEMLKELEK
jgi:hypothetical protein